MYDSCSSGSSSSNSSIGREEPEDDAYAFVDCSASEDSYEFPWPTLPLSDHKPSSEATLASREIEGQTNDDGDSDFEENNDLCENEIVRSKCKPEIYVLKVLKSDTTKDGKSKKGSRVYNMRHCCPIAKSS